MSSWFLLRNPHLPASLLVLGIQALSWFLLVEIPVCVSNFSCFVISLRRTWDVCVYMNIYNTDLKIKFHNVHIFLICAKNVFSEKILFSYSDFVLSLICTSALRYSTGPAPTIWKCHTHIKSLYKRLASLFPVTLTSPPTS